MQPFDYIRPETLSDALTLIRKPGASILAGGTTLVDLMRADLAQPQTVIDISHLVGLDDIVVKDAALHLGALVRMADLAEHPALLQDYPILAESLKLGASQQIRNVATLGGNLLQKTRCPYYRGGVSPCNKRSPGSGCAAIDGDDRDMALFGTSYDCIANYPGDFGVGLAALDTEIVIRSSEAERRVAMADFFVPYGDDPQKETVLRPGEIITGLSVSAPFSCRKSTYVKVRDRQSYAYAVVSVAIALEMEGDLVTGARVAVGGVSSYPRRFRETENALVGRRLTEATALEAGEAGFVGAKPRRHNAFKIELGRRAIARAALQAARKSQV